MIMSVIGLAFKVAAAPFHLWAPDTYQTAPIPSAAFIASASKVAGFFILAKLLIYGFAGSGGSASWAAWSAGWVSLVSILALVSIIAGNLLAIVQSSVRRLIAYSAVAHSGYALLGIVAGNEAGMASLIYYVITYGFTVVGAFGVVAIVEGKAGEDRLTAFAGLHRTQPLASACMLVFMLSLAGIPPLAGFFGKFYVFAAVLQKSMGLVWLVVVALVMSAVSLYYYLQVLKRIYVTESDLALDAQGIPWVQKGALTIVAAAVVGLGCFPGPFVRWITEAIGG
jgi:NADH-quinone oxidoreductase subunit N